MSRLATRRRDLGRHTQHAGLTRLGGVKHTARHEELDYVSTMRGDVMHLLGSLLGSIRHHGEEAGAVAARNGNARTGSDDARANVATSLDSITNGDVCK